MPQPSYYVNKDNNNPSKEIWANSGIYDQKSYGPSQYAQDITHQYHHYYQQIALYYPHQLIHFLVEITLLIIWIYLIHLGIIVYQQ